MSWVARRYAGFWILVLASIIDSLWMAVFTFVIGFGLNSALDIATSGAGLAGAIDLFASFLAPLMLVIAVWRLKQTTPGKAIFGCRIVDAATGAAPSTAQCMVRYLGYFPSIALLGLGLLWIAFDARKQGWHDKLARTVVVQDMDGAL